MAEVINMVDRMMQNSLARLDAEVGMRITRIGRFRETPEIAQPPMILECTTESDRGPSGREERLWKVWDAHTNAFMGCWWRPNFMRLVHQAEREGWTITDDVYGTYVDNGVLVNPVPGSEPD